MKKILAFFVLLFVALFVTSCEYVASSNSTTKSNQSTTQSSAVESSTSSSLPILSSVEFLAMNDIHGHIEDPDDMIFFSHTAEYLRTEKENNNAIIISSGDTFQGTALSNLGQGRVLIDSMNVAGFDCMTIGNHEFDWGIDKITQYRDGDASNGEANFPLLAANIYDKTTGIRLQHTDEYTIVERGGHKVGIIGVIGQVQNSIAVKSLGNYEFRDQYQIVKTLAYDLRVNKSCDVVVVSTHDGSGGNSRYAQMTGNSKIDAVFNAHTHQLENDPKGDMAYIQSSCNGEYVGRVVLNMNGSSVVSFEEKNLDASNFKDVNQDVENIIESEKTRLASVINQVLSPEYTDSWMTHGNMAIYVDKMLCNIYDADYAVCNAGGFRTYWTKGQPITYGDLYEMVPFDNTVEIGWLTGADLKLVLTKDTCYLRIPKSSIEDDKYYKVCGISYVMDKHSVFTESKDFHDTFDVMREILKEDIMLHTNSFSFEGEPLLTSYSHN